MYDKQYGIDTIAGYLSDNPGLEVSLRQKSGEWVLFDVQIAGVHRVDGTQQNEPYMVYTMIKIVPGYGQTPEEVRAAAKKVVPEPKAKVGRPKKVAA